eukprot:m.21620 g.21620  ORF g.21620 m.21620 type:complete len:731 (+) comp28191_c0_seq2:264-2456(+)
MPVRYRHSEQKPKVLYSAEESTDASKDEETLSVWAKCLWILFCAFCGLFFSILVFALVNPTVFWHVVEDPSRGIMLIKAILPEGIGLNGGAEAAEVTSNDNDAEKYLFETLTSSSEPVCHHPGDCQEHLPGHMQPIGDQRPPDFEIDEMQDWPDSRVFYRDYVRRRKPLVMRGAARLWPAFKSWTDDDYLREHFGETYFYVQPSKSYSNVSYPLTKVMKLSEFLSRFRNESLYLDSRCAATGLLNDTMLPGCLLCREMTEGLSSTTLLMSNGNTSSSLHHDGYENILTILSGSKTVLLFNSTTANLLYGNDFLVHPALSPIEPEAVNLVKYPGFAEAPYARVTLHAGDSLYLPEYWWHHVRSYGSPNIAFNIWFGQFNYEEDMKEAGINEDVEVEKVIQYFNERIEHEPDEIPCTERIEMRPLSRSFRDLPPEFFVKPVPKPDDARLASGYQMPLLGIGTAGLFGSEVIDIVKHALKIGYRMIDSAQAYDEASVGRGIAESGVDRSSIFIVSKLHPRFMGFESTIKAVATSLSNLQTNYIDLFLIHSPDCDEGEDARLKCEEGEPKGSWQESWRALETLQKDGTLRSIGVSNFEEELLQELVDLAKVPVSVVQNWFDPFFQDRNVRRFCRGNGIVYMGYSTLGTLWKEEGVLDYNPVLKNRGTLAHLASEREATIAQIVLRWAIDSDVVVIPRSSNPIHVNTNWMALETLVTEQDRLAINDLDGEIVMPD